MKKIIMLTMLFAFVTASFGQQITPRQDWTETDYYKKSKKQKTAAWILLGSGVAIFTGGLIAHFIYIQPRADYPSAELTRSPPVKLLPPLVFLQREAAFHYLLLHQKTRKKQKQLPFLLI
jgi:heme/copper-type cytochrome/quinol oxidase subunit 3